MADMNKLQEKYRTRASGAAQDLVDNYTARTDKLARASSDNAEKAYAAGVQNAVAKKRRQKGLKKLSEEDLNKGMRDKGQTAYSTAVNASGDKWSKNAAPFISEAERISASLPARSADPLANVDARVKPVVKGLSDLKDKMS